MKLQKTMDYEIDYDIPPTDAKFWESTGQLPNVKPLVLRLTKNVEWFMARRRVPDQDQRPGSYVQAILAWEA